MRILVKFLALSALLLSQTALAQVWWHSYSPDSARQVYSDALRYREVSLPNNTTFYTNIWGPHNTSSWGYDSNRNQLPLRMYFEINSKTNRTWEVHYDIKGRIPLGDPYTSASEPGYHDVKGFPSIGYEPVNLPVYLGETKKLTCHWNMTALSNDWANNKFNSIIEIRLAKFGNDGKAIPSTKYIIQLEIMQANYGTPGQPNVTLAGKSWTKGRFTAFGEPVYKFILQGAGVKSNTSRTVELDLFPFMQYTATYPYWFDNASFNRANWNAKVTAVSAGIEPCKGKNAIFRTNRYWIAESNK
jgi:hypothetical protein